MVGVILMTLAVSFSVMKICVTSLSPYPASTCVDPELCLFLTAFFLVGDCCSIAFFRHTDPVPGFIELTGDLRLHRFLEGYNSDPTMAAEAYVSMLVWRQRNDMDNVRNALANGAWILISLVELEGELHK